MKITRTITAPDTPPSAVFAYLSDFTTSEEWDPGTLETTLVEGDGGVGSRYRNRSVFRGRETELTYVTVDLQPDRLVVMRAGEVVEGALSLGLLDGLVHDGLDVVGLQPAGAGLGLRATGVLGWSVGITHGAPPAVHPARGGSAHAAVPPGSSCRCSVTSRYTGGATHARGGAPRTAPAAHTSRPSEADRSAVRSAAAMAAAP